MARLGASAKEVWMDCGYTKDDSSALGLGGSGRPYKYQERLKHFSRRVAK